MNVLPESSLILGIIPALVLLYWVLKDWQGEYVEKTLFIMFILGIVVGFIASVIEIFTLTSGILIIILFPILEQIMKTMVLNLPRFHNKKSTVLYGLALGLGFGSIFTPVSMLLASIQATSLLVISAILVGSIGIILMQGATGLIIGYGIYEGNLSKHYLIAVLLYVPVSLWFFLTGFYHIEQYQIGIILYGILIYWYVLKTYMKPVIALKKRQRKRSQQ